MSVVTKQMFFDLACKILDDFKDIGAGQVDIKRELREMRGACIEMQRDIHAIYGVLAQMDDRFDRIERRLDARAWPQPA